MPNFCNRCPMTTALSPDLQAKVAAAKAILQEITSKHGKVVFANSLGAEDMVITDLLRKDFTQVDIFSLDTGRLPAETYDLMQKTEDRYNFKLTYYYPDTTTIEQFTRTKGINAFYNSVDLRKECCNIRKVEPLKRALASQGAWITGLRRSQSVTRLDVPAIEFDKAFGLDKANPLIDWEESDVWAYIKALDIPYNALHDRNYPSIGCAPCTRAISKGEDIRAGRWWWENPETKECGLHAGKPNAA
ncbi:MAG: phosphoadenylyl-sulfate reductase [Gammaproteobacteria bacterium]|nr:phosphoadenylyl-sulfate reductase [Gammaproteobacteria bacterium]